MERAGDGGIGSRLARPKEKSHDNECAKSAEGHRSKSDAHEPCDRGADAPPANNANQRAARPQSVSQPASWDFAHRIGDGKSSECPFQVGDTGERKLGGKLWGCCPEADAIDVGDHRQRAGKCQHLIPYSRFRESVARRLSFWIALGSDGVGDGHKRPRSKTFARHYCISRPTTATCWPRGTVAVHACTKTTPSIAAIAPQGSASMWSKSCKSPMVWPRFTRDPQSTSGS